jgi:hypothetical protein
VLNTIVIESKNPCSALFGWFTPSNKRVKIPGTRRSPTPNESAAARTKRSPRVKRTYEKARRPETATEVKSKVVMLPRTGLGIATRAPEILPRMPKRMRKTQHQRPAARLAQRVMAMAPLFWWLG